MTNRDDGLAYADVWDEGAGRYRGLRAGKVGAITLEGESVVITRGLAKMLEPGEYATKWADDLSFLDGVKSMFIWDSAGRKWRVPGRHLRRAMRECANIAKSITTPGT